LNDRDDCRCVLRWPMRLRPLPSPGMEAIMQKECCTFGRAARLTIAPDLRRFPVGGLGLLLERRRCRNYSFVGGNHKVRVLKVTHDSLAEDTRSGPDWNTTFSTGPVAASRAGSRATACKCRRWVFRRAGRREVRLPGSAREEWVTLRRRPPSCPTARGWPFAGRAVFPGRCPGL